MATTFPIIRFNILGEMIIFQDDDVIDADVVQEIHPVSIEVPASTARIRLWLDDTKPLIDHYIEITGAGVDAVNGIYEICTAPQSTDLVYINNATGVFIYWTGYSWQILAESFFPVYYESSDAVSSPDLVTTWVVCHYGELPLPTVTYVPQHVGLSLRDRFSPFSDGTYYQAMTTGLVVDVSESVDGSEHAIGRFYLDEWKIPKEGELELVCTDIIGTLENKNYLGNFYETPTLVGRIIDDILLGVGVLVEIDGSISSKKLKGYIPGNITLREALQQVLFVCGAYVLSTGGSKLKIKASPIPAGDADIDVTITDQDKTDANPLSIQPIVTGVEIVSHDYSKGQTLEEIFSAFLAPGDYMVVYPKPYWHVEAVGVGDALIYLATTNDEVLVSPDSGTYPNCTIYTINGEFDFGTNYIYLHVPEPGGEVIVRGKPWLDATQIFSWTNPNAGSALPNVWKIDNATLVPSIATSTEETVENVLARVVSYASLRYLQKATLFPRSDVDLGKVALVDSLYGKDIVGIVKKMTSNLSGGYLLDTEFVGEEHL